MPEKENIFIKEVDKWSAVILNKTYLRTKPQDIIKDIVVGACYCLVNMLLSNL